MPNPRFSVITPVFNPPAVILQETIDSVRAQTYEDWELCLVDDCSTQPHVRALLNQAASEDPRIRVAYRSDNGGIVAATNDALAMARGVFVSFLDHDDLLAPAALELVAAFIDADPDDEVDYVYTDEDKVDEFGVRSNAFLKPDWSPDRFRCQMYVCHLSTVRRTILDEVGGLRSGFEGSQDFDLILRVTEKARKVAHVPAVLYHWRTLSTSTALSAQAKPYAFVAGQNAISEHLERVGFPATVDRDDTLPGLYRLVPNLPRQPLVSIVIPTIGVQRYLHGIATTLVENCVRAIVDKSTYENYEIVIVCGIGTPEPVLDELRRIGGDRLRVAPYDRPFNFSSTVNVGVLRSEGEFVLLLNDDTEPIAPDWIESMVMFGLDPAVGIVGARLRFADRTLQHAGIVCSAGSPHHKFHGFPPDFGGYFSNALVAGNYLAVTAACMLVDRGVFDEVGGFSPLFPLNFNDVDFCLKVHRAGYRTVYSPWAELFHYESSTRPAVVEDAELDLLRSRWCDIMLHDPYYNQQFHQEAAPYERANAGLGLILD